MKKKRLIAMILACIMLLSLLAACNKNSADKTPGGNTPSNSADKNGDKTDNSGKNQGGSNTPEKPEYAYVPTYYPMEYAGDQELQWIEQVQIVGEKIYFVSQVIAGKKTSTYINEETGEEESYEYDAYESVLFQMDLDGKNCKRLESYHPIEIEEGKDAWSGVNGIFSNPNGNIQILEMYNETIYDLPEDFDPETMDRWEFYSGEKSMARLVEVTPEDEVVNDYTISFEEGQYMYNILLDAKGNLYASDGSIIAIYKPDGTKAATIDIMEKAQYGGNMMKMGDNVCLLAWAEEGQSVYPIDSETYELGEALTLSSRAYNFYPGFGNYEYLYDYNGSIYGHIKDADVNTDEKVLDWLDCDVDSSNINSFTFLPDGRVVAFSQEYDNTTYKVNYNVIMLNRVERSTLPEKRELTFACMYLDWNVRRRILSFNRSHDDIRIVVRDYSEFNTEDDYNAGMTKLNTEMLSGNIPDIVYLDNLPVRRYAAKGFLLDLWPLIDADPDLGRDQLVTELFDALSIDGKLYQVCENFSIRTLAGNKDVIGDGTSWTVQELMNAAKNLEEGATVLGQYNTKANVLQNCLFKNMAYFVDWSTGKCNFDSQEFIDILKFTEMFPKEFNYEDIDWETYEYESDASRLMNGRQLLLEQYLYSFSDFQYTSKIFQDNANFIGYPTTTGDGNSFEVNGTIGISSTCSDVDTAWSFVRQMLLAENQIQEYMYQFPTNRKAFEELKRQAMTDETWTDENGEVHKQPKNVIWYSDEEQVEIYAMTQEEMDAFDEFFSRIKTVGSYDQQIFDIINEQAEAFFDGARSAEETARMIQSRTSLYIAEQR